jgi:hypothetical protein
MVLMAFASARAQTPAAANGPSSDSAFGACTAGNSIIIANSCEGATLGAKVNAADAVLGGNPGEIRLYGGGAFGDEHSRIIISSHHTLRIFAGTYTSTGMFGVISLKDDSALICEDPSNTILQESTRAAIPQTDMWSIVNPYGATSVGGKYVAEPNRNISIKNCRFKGTRTDVSTAQPTVYMGCCHNCEVSGNVFDNTHGIGTAWGMSGLVSDPLSLGMFAENISEHHNTYIAVTGVSTAIINVKNGSVHHNFYQRPGNPRLMAYTAAVDLEPNRSTDQVVGVSVTENVMDMYGSVNYVNGVSISNAANARYERILIADNLMYGSNTAGSDIRHRRLSMGIRISANVRGVLVRGNRITFAKHPIGVAGTANVIENNRIFGETDPVNGGYPIQLFTQSADNIVKDNLISCLAKVCSVLVKNIGAASNVVSDNHRVEMPGIAAGKGAGTLPKLTITGDDSQGYIDLTTGSSPFADAPIAIIAYASKRVHGPVSIPLVPANPDAAALSGNGQAYVDLKSSGAASFVIKAGKTPLAARTNYRWFYGPAK